MTLAEVTRSAATWRLLGRDVACESRAVGLAGRCERRACAVASFGAELR